MRIDWTTFVLEIINFLALVWLLKRFLYQPVRDVLAARQARVTARIDEATAMEQRADELRRQYESRLADWDAEKAQARSQLADELTQERNRQMQALKQALADEQARDAALATQRQAELRRALEGEAMSNAQEFTAALLARLGDPAVEARLVDLLLDDFADLPETQLQGWRQALSLAATEAVVTSARPLAADQRLRIKTAVANRLGIDLPLTFREDATLLCGVRLALGAYQLSLAFADELAVFRTAADHVC